MADINYDRHQHRVYHAGRRHPEATLDGWSRLLRARAGEPPPRRWLDLGAGTGRFSTVLADLFEGEVVGVEPSAGMRAEAERHSAHPRVRYEEGCAEAIPQDDGAFDAAFMSMVYHHLRKPEAAAREIRRVLRPGGRLLMRTATVDSHFGSTFYELFVEARAIDEQRLPSLVELRTFGRAGGFAQAHHEVVEQVTDASLVAFRDRMHVRPFSTFELMTETEIEAGFGRLSEALEQHGERLAIELVDFLVLEATRVDPVRPRSSTDRDLFDHQVQLHRRRCGARRRSRGR